MELLRGVWNRLVIGLHHRKIVGGVVAGILLPGYQVVPVHAFRDLVVIVFVSACFTSLRGRTPITSAPSPGSVTIITSRHGGATNAQPSHFNLERSKSDKLQVNASSSQRPSAAKVRDTNPTKGKSMHVQVSSHQQLW